MRRDAPFFEQRLLRWQLLEAEPGADLVRRVAQILLVLRRLGHHVTDVRDDDVDHQPRQQHHDGGRHRKTNKARHDLAANPEPEAEFRQRVEQRLDQIPDEDGDYKTAG